MVKRSTAFLLIHPAFLDSVPDEKGEIMVDGWIERSGEQKVIVVSDVATGELCSSE